MTDRRGKNYSWYPLDEQGHAPTWERINTAILMDLRDELQKLNARLDCYEFLSIPRVLRSIRANTAKPKKRKVAQA